MPATEQAIMGYVSLTYDGSTLSQLETAVPQLDAFGLRGTFYADPAQLLSAYRGWLDAAVTGHEIGNGSLLGAALPDGSLPAWTTAMVAAELDEADEFLRAHFPAPSGISFAFPPGEPRAANDVDYSAVVDARYSVIRTSQSGLNRQGEDSRRLKSLGTDGMTAKDLIDAARLTIADGAWAIFAFADVGVGDPSVDALAHLALCEWLSANADLVTTGPVAQVADLFGAPVAPRLHLA